MDRKFSQSVRAKSGQRGSYHACVGFGRQAAAAAPNFFTDAYFHLRKQTNTPKVDLCSTSSDGSTAEADSELHGNLCKKVDVPPMNKITDEVASRGVGKKRSSPSVIARLMGLDELSSPQIVSELENESGYYLLKKSFSGQRDKYECSGNHSCHVSRRQHQNFKNVQDLFDSSKAKKHIDQVVQKEKLCSKPDMTFIKQKFMEAKCLSTNEALEKSKKFNALEIRDANKGIFLKFLQKPNSLFAKHFQDLKLSKSSTHTSHFKILETSVVNRQEKSETFCRSVEENQGCAQKKKATAHCCAKPNSRLDNHSTYDHVDSLWPKLLRLQPAGKMETSSHQTSIVILKPSVQKVERTGRIKSFPRSIQNYRLSCRRHREFHRELFVEKGEQHQLFDVKTEGFKTKVTREVARDNSEKLKHSLSRYSADVLASKKDCYDSSSTYLNESFLSKETVKGRSEQWKITRPFKQRLVGEGSSTLGEMLSISDKGPRTLGQLIFKNSSDKNFDQEYIHGSWAYPRINNNDGWKEKCDASLPRFEDHPNSSAINGSSKPGKKLQVGCTNSIDDCYMLKDVLNLEKNDLHSSIIDREHSLLRNCKRRDNKPRLFRSCGEENRSPVREVEVWKDEPRNMIYLNNLIEPKPIDLQRNMKDLLHMVHNASNQKNFVSDKSFLTNLKEFQESAKFKDLSVIILENESPEVASVDFPVGESPLDVKVPKVVERRSPVSVLELPSDDGKSTQECLESIGAGLVGKCKHFDETSREIMKSLKNGGDRDLLYLLNILSVSGIFAASQNKFFDACYSPDNPVFPDVFDKLEKRYNMVNLWSRSERKLLFDHINSILAEVLAPCMDLHPWVKLKGGTCVHDRLVLESCRMVVRRRKELSTGKPEEKVLDILWLYLDDYVDMIGREIERMLKDDLLNELVSDFVLG